MTRTYLSPTKRSIIVELRRGPLDQFQIAAGTREALFVVRAELLALRRQRLVADRLTSRAHVWELTDRGHQAVLLEAREELQVSYRTGR